MEETSRKNNLKKYETTLIFDSLHRPINANPLLFLHDEITGVYYYLKSQTISEEEIAKKHKNTEVLIPKLTETGTWFNYYSLVDGSQIFRIDEKDFRDFQSSNPEVEIEKIWKLDYHLAMTIFDKIEKCLKQKMPFISYSAVSYSESSNQATPKTLYASFEHYANDLVESVALGLIDNEECQRKLQSIEQEKFSELEKKQRIPYYFNVINSILKSAKEYYLDLKINYPLTKWINENERITPDAEKSRWTSSLILKHINELYKKSVIDHKIRPVTIYPANRDNIAKGLIDLGNEKLLKEIWKRDFHYMLNWFEENNLPETRMSFLKFVKQMVKDGNENYFFFDKLEKNLSNRIIINRIKENQIKNFFESIIQSNKITHLDKEKARILLEEFIEKLKEQEGQRQKQEEEERKAENKEEDGEGDLN